MRVSTPPNAFCNLAFEVRRPRYYVGRADYSGSFIQEQRVVTRVDLKGNGLNLDNRDVQVANIVVSPLDTGSSAEVPMRSTLVEYLNRQTSP